MANCGATYFSVSGMPPIFSTTRFGARLLLGRPRTEAPSHVIDLLFLRPLSLACSSERLPCGNSLVVGQGKRGLRANFDLEAQL